MYAFGVLGFKIPGSAAFHKIIIYLVIPTLFSKFDIIKGYGS